jgi:hypothetical protein
MEIYCVETQISNGGTLVLEGLPFPQGKQVEVTVRPREPTKKTGDERHPLRGKPVRYLDPFESVDQDSWKACQ